MKHVVPTLTLVVLLLSTVNVRAWAASDAVVSGVVRDAHGTPQLGAMVELLSADASVVARAFTDDHGRYLLDAALPGNYQLRASAAFLIPTVRANLRLRAGARAIADLTMTAIFETGSWLPTEGRKPSEPSDDWRWTLRSTANRPMLRLVDDGSASDSDGVSSSSESHPQRMVAEGQLSLIAGDGSFGEGGTHQLLRLDRAGLDGEASVLKANVGDGLASGVGASIAIAAGMERKRVFGGDTRIFVSFSSHPELETGAGLGLQVLRTATSEQMSLGDMIAIDAGTLFTAERLVGERFNSAPYVRVAFRPAPELTLEYRFATDRNLQRSQDLDQTAAPEQELSDTEGQPILKRALHQELAATRSVEKDVITVAVYKDAVPVEGVLGGGEALQDLAGLPILADPTTGTFRVALQGYTGDGMRVSWTRVVSPVLSACVEGEFGTALRADGEPLDVSGLPAAIHPRGTAALSAAADLGVKRTGTSLNVRYRWQPYRSLSQVDEFDAMPGDAYLGVRFKQRLWAGRRLKGVNAVVQATNLLAQGYEPLLGPDGETLFLAQVPRGVQGGLAFNF